MKILALDIGEKRIGLALGESTLGLAFPQGILQVEHLELPTQFAHIRDFCVTNVIARVLIGHPAALGTSGSVQAEICREFADGLEDFLLQNGLEIPVEFVDESFSTQMAMRQLHDLGQTSADQKNGKDALAAAAFLQTYFDRNKGEAKNRM